MSVYKPAPGRYCLAVCYCGECDHYKPLRRHADSIEAPVPTKPAPTVTAWDEREEGSSWIDRL